MTYNGAAGSTKDGMARALGVDGLSLADVNTGQATLLRTMTASDPKVQTYIANALWAQPRYTFLQEFIDRNRDYYRAQVTTTDVASDAGVKTINGWVARETRGKIPDLLKSGDLDASTRLVLTNAVYFKGEWAHAFDKKLTYDGQFTLATGTKNPVKMMTQQGTFPYFEDGTMQTISLPYGKGGMSMIVVLPAQGSTPDDLTTSMTAERWDGVMQRLTEQGVNLSLPRFKEKYEALLNDPLAALGMGEAFSNAADFSGMTGNNDLYISLVRHQALIEVNEAGTEAAAATGVVMALRSAPRTAQMVVDRPFLFAIRDNASGVLLFLGRVNTPG